MSIFGKIMGAIFGSSASAAAPDAAPAAGGAAAPAGGAAPAATVDVAVGDGLDDAPPRLVGPVGRRGGPLQDWHGS